MQWTPPSPGDLDWVARALGEPDVDWSRRLLGGTHALTDVLRTAGREVVLRRFGCGDDAVRREQRVLAVLDGLEGLAPRMLAADADGSVTGRPAILTDLLPGSPDLVPVDPLAAGHRLGAALAEVHARPCPERLPELPRPATRGPGADTAEGRSEAATARPVLTHRDFWTGNTLWAGEELTGIVDWSGAGRAPRGLDVSWARLDLVLLHGEAAADGFAASYEQCSGIGVPRLVRWDRWAAAEAADHVEEWAPNYQGLGRLDLDGPTLRARLDAWRTRLDSR